MLFVNVNSFSQHKLTTIYNSIIYDGIFCYVSLHYQILIQHQQIMIWRENDALTIVLVCPPKSSSFSRLGFYYYYKNYS